MHRKLRSVVAGLLVAGAAAGCHGAQSSASGAPEPNADIIVNVTNNYGTTMDVYVLGGSTVQRLGVVGPATTRSFTVPAVVVLGGGSVRFRAQPTGYGPIVDTDPVVLQPGHVVEFEIATNLVGSHANVR